jgi:hypothetical protein
MKTALIAGGAVVGLYLLWKYVQGAPTSADNTAQGVSMTAGGQANTVYGAGQAIGVGAAAPTMPVHSAFPITSPTPQSPFVALTRAIAAATQQVAPAPAPTSQPSRFLVPKVLGFTASSPIT